MCVCPLFSRGFPLRLLRFLAILFPLPPAFLRPACVSKRFIHGFMGGFALPPKQAPFKGAFSCFRFALVSWIVTHSTLVSPTFPFIAFAVEACGLPFVYRHSAFRLPAILRLPSSRAKTLCERLSTVTIAAQYLPVRNVILFTAPCNGRNVVSVCFALCSTHTTARPALPSISQQNSRPPFLVGTVAVDRVAACRASPLAFSQPLGHKRCNALRHGLTL